MSNEDNYAERIFENLNSNALVVESFDEALERIAERLNMNKSEVRRGLTLLLDQKRLLKLVGHSTYIEYPSGPVCMRTFITLSTAKQKKIRQRTIRPVQPESRPNKSERRLTKDEEARMRRNVFGKGLRPSTNSNARSSNWGTKWVGRQGGPKIGPNSPRHSS